MSKLSNAHKSRITLHPADNRHGLFRVVAAACMPQRAGRTAQGVLALRQRPLPLGPARAFSLAARLCPARRRLAGQEVVGLVDHLQPAQEVVVGQPRELAPRMLLQARSCALVRAYAFEMRSKAGAQRPVECQSWRVGVGAGGTNAIEPEQSEHLTKFVGALRILGPVVFRVILFVTRWVEYYFASAILERFVVFVV